MSYPTARDRFIPAGAGNTWIARADLFWTMVHPRRRGEHRKIQWANPTADGSSPQARGTLTSIHDRITPGRFIPAGAGNTPPAQRFGRTLPVHPRRRGEHTRSWAGGGKNAGSSPQARGTRPRRAQWCIRSRFIPAGAGNTLCLSASKKRRTVHPRRRGEHLNVPWSNTAIHGSSPQARGTLTKSQELIDIKRFIPAGAGNTAPRTKPESCSSVHPRRRGEHRCEIIAPELSHGSSPQARGTHQ